MFGRDKGRLAAVCLVLWLATPAAAQEEKDRQAPKLRFSYVFAGLGYFEGNEDLAGEIPTGMAVNFGFARRFNRTLSGEIEASYAVTNFATSEDNRFVSGDARLSSFALMLNLKVTVPVWKLEPYAGFGVGPVVAEFDSSTVLFIRSGSRARGGGGFARQVVIGVDFAYTRRSRFGLEFRHFGSELDFEHLLLGQIDIGGNAIMLTIKIPI